MLIAFLFWWACQLRELLPARLHGIGAAGPKTIVTFDPGSPGAGPRFGIAPDGADGTFRHVTLDDAGVAAARAMLAGRRHSARVVLRLPDSQVLVRDVVLPLAAERDPEAVLGFEMDRLTPFRTADVLWQADGLRRDRARNRLSLRLSLLPRTEFAAALPALARLGLTPEAVEVRCAGTAPEGSWRRLPLARPAGATRRERQRLRAGFAVVAGLAVIAAALPFVWQALAERALAARIAALTPQVQEVAVLRRHLAHADGAAAAFAALAAQVGNPLAVLAALTTILPDDTYLESLTLAQRRLAITGRSAAAARLIGLLAANPIMRTPAFVAPVTRTPDGVDAFAIAADVAP
jgi:general secretion pathway protein L